MDDPIDRLDVSPMCPTHFADLARDAGASMLWVIHPVVRVEPGLRDFVRQFVRTCYGAHETPRPLIGTDWRGVPWVAVAVPRQDRWLADRAAEAAGMRLNRNAPVFVDGRGLREAFPVPAMCLVPRDCAEATPIVAALRLEGATFAEALRKFEAFVRKAMPEVDPTTTTR